MTALDTALRQAVDLHRAGRLIEAEAAYRTILARWPGQVEAGHNLGIVLRRFGRHPEALPFLKGALEQAPSQGQFWLSYVDALIHVGQIDAARQVLRLGRERHGLGGAAVDALAARLGAATGPQDAAQPGASMATKAAPGDVQAGIRHVVELFGQQRFAELEDFARGYLARYPDQGFVWKVLGVARKHLGEDAAALTAMTEAARLSPDDFEAHYNLGNARYEAGDADQATACFQAALALNPGHAETRNNLGQTLVELGRYDEALPLFQAALELKPDLLAAYNNLGNLRLARREYVDAEGHSRRALALDPASAEAHYNLGVALYEQCRFDEAEASTRRALQLKADYAKAHLGLGNLLQCRGRLDEALRCFRHAIANEADFAGNYASLLFTLNYDPERSGEEIFSVYREFDERFGLPLRVTWRAHDNDRNPARRLRVGYVSPDFCRHVVRYFLEPLLAHHDKAAVEVFAYAEVRREDDVTARLRTYADHWLSTLGMSDDALAERIRADGIDILVDLAGHTAGNRLLVFARQPAPVSVSWLGYGYTTGLSAIDYLLTDEASAPAGSEPLFAETPWRLATPGYVYRPAEGMGEVSALPALACGFVTFGTLTRGVRINHRTIRVWAAILRRLPDARLVIDSGHFKEASAQEALAARFAAHGIGAERLAIGCHSPPWDVLRGMDIGLDCFPHNSGTTLFESLYMGVPFVTLAGRPSVGRLGSSILAGVGHPEWIARSEEEYIEKAVALATNLPKLAAIRAGLREEMHHSPLMDETGFARRVESAYRGMFTRWANGQRG